MHTYNLNIQTVEAQCFNNNVQDLLSASGGGDFPLSVSISVSTALTISETRCFRWHMLTMSTLGQLRPTWATYRGAVLKSKHKYFHKIWSLCQHSCFFYIFAISRAVAAVWMCVFLVMATVCCLIGPLEQILPFGNGMRVWGDGTGRVC
jgi:hypothetical protein